MAPIHHREHANISCVNKWGYLTFRRYFIVHSQAHPPNSEGVPLTPGRNDEPVPSILLQHDVLGDDAIRTLEQLDSYSFRCRFYSRAGPLSCSKINVARK